MICGVVSHNYFCISKIMADNVIPVGGAVVDGGDGAAAGGSGGLAAAQKERIKSVSNMLLESLPFLNLDEIQKKLDMAKELARKGQKQGEVGKHKSPQVKRSLNFMFDVLFTAEDMEESVNRMIRATETEEDIKVEDWLKLKENILKVKSLTKEEMMKNKMASKSIAGWKTVSHFETDNLFESEDEDTADRLTKKFKAAEYKAIGDFNRAKRSRGRGFGYRGGRGRGGYGGYSDGRREERDRDDRRDKPSYSGDRLANMACHRCNKLGHLIRDCPVSK
jgi:hypothetical protein